MTAPPESRDPPAGGDELALLIRNLRHKSAGDMYADCYGEEFRGDPAEIADMLESQAATIATLQRDAERYRLALETIQHWDCLNPPRPELLGDLPWLRRLVDAALADEEPKA